MVGEGGRVAERVRTDSSQCGEVDPPIRGASGAAGVAGGRLGERRERRPSARGQGSHGERERGGVVPELCAVVSKPALDEAHGGVGGLELESLRVQAREQARARRAHVLADGRQRVHQVRLRLLHRFGPRPAGLAVRGGAPLGDRAQVVAVRVQLRTDALQLSRHARWRQAGRGEKARSLRRLAAFSFT